MAFISQTLWPKEQQQHEKKVTKSSTTLSCFAKTKTFVDMSQFIFSERRVLILTLKTRASVSLLSCYY